MNWATVIYLAFMFGAMYLLYRLGAKREQLKQATQYKKDVNEYIVKQNEIDAIDRDGFTNDDIMSGNVLTGKDTEASTTEPEPRENYSDRR